MVNWMLFESAKNVFVEDIHVCSFSLNIYSLIWFLTQPDKYHTTTRSFQYHHSDLKLMAWLTGRFKWDVSVGPGQVGGEH